MSMSMASGAKYEREATSLNVGDLAAALAKGLLMGARGNSGVILSQIFRGFSKDVEGKKTLTVDEFVHAYAAGAQTAYKAVMKPTEGTILTVVRESAQAGINDVEAGKNQDMVAVMQDILDAGQAALKKTPDLLAVLKEVGVVDSGGQGLVFVLQGFYDALTGKESDEQPDNAQIDEMINAKHHQSAQGKLNPEDIKYGYCTQMMVRLGRGKEVDRKFDYDTFYNYLAKLGDSLLVINDDEVVRVHVHTEHPGKVLSWGQEFGDLQTVKVDNMRWQQESIIAKDDNDNNESDTPVERAKKEQAAEAPQTAVIAVVAGDGVAKLYKGMGVTTIINGGQTMNPSIEDITNAINNSGAKQALVLPNNGNIFMAADQAAEVADIPVEVVHSKSIAQGMTALLEYNQEASLKENHDNMEANCANVKSGEVTIAVRDTKLNGREIKKDDYMGIVDGEITNTNPDVQQAATDMVKHMLDEDSEVVTILYGQDGDQSTAEAIRDEVLAADDELDVQIYEGDQPVYPYLISVE